MRPAVTLDLARGIGPLFNDNNPGHRYPSAGYQDLLVGGIGNKWASLQV